MNKKIVLVSGSSGVGKSTLRLILRNQLGENFNNRIAGIDIDDVYCFVDPKFAAPNYLELWKKARQNTGFLTTSLLRNDTEAVFIFSNTIFSKDQVNDILNEVQVEDQVDIFHITLAPSRDTVAERLKKRQYSVPIWLDEHLAERQPHLNEDWTILINNSKLTPEQTLEAIYEIIKKGNIMKKLESTNMESNSWFSKIFKL